MNLNRGFYAILEGNDGVGKTTTMAAVAAEIQKAIPDVIQTHHPGSTPLGKHLRQLIKRPHSFGPDIVIDELSRQVLYMADTVSFVKTLLVPSLEQNKVVLADRSSFISSVVYGLTDGLRITDIEKLAMLITPPRADKLYVLTCPALVGRARVLADRVGGEADDHYDRKSEEFAVRIARLYDNLVTTSPELTALVGRAVAIDDLIYVDATLPPHRVVDIIVHDMMSAIKERCVFSTA